MSARNVIRATIGGVTRYVDPKRPALPTGVLDFQTGNLAQWMSTHVERSEQVSIVSAPARPGYTHSGRFEVTATDFWGVDAGTVRGEVVASEPATGRFLQGDEQWYAWSTYFPADFEWDGWGQEFFLYTQWHGTPNAGKPHLSFRVTTGPSPRLVLQAYGGSLNTTTGAAQHFQSFDLGPLQRGVWLDHVVRVKWGDTPTSGEVTVWINGAQVLPKTSMANIYTGHSGYLKQGIYASDFTNRTHVLYITGTVCGKYLSDLPPALRSI